MREARIRVLFVDDSPYVLEGIARTLHGIEDDWEVQYADSGEGALALIAQTPFDIVATDLKMPGMDGEALIRGIHALRPEVRCILLCGDPDDPQALAMAREGCPIIEKPCDGSDIRSAIEAEIRHRNGDGHGTVRNNMKESVQKRGIIGQDQ